MDNSQAEQDEKSFIGHIDPETRRIQTLLEHLEGAASVCASNGCDDFLPYTRKLLGLIHDLGKAKKEFVEYILKNLTALKGKINHSSHGARYLHETIHPETTEDRVLLELLETAIVSHHSGLCDVTETDGADGLQNKEYPEREICYEEVVNNINILFPGRNILIDLFHKASHEFQEYFTKIYPSLPKDPAQVNFYFGILQRFLFSCLIDADRYDTYLFQQGLSYIPTKVSQQFWDRCLSDMEISLTRSPLPESKINRIRDEIAEECMRFTPQNGGIYRFLVPTGGGKTIASLRMGLSWAASLNKEHIYYIAPFKTILEQNASVMKDLLPNEKDSILEHHSDIISDDEQYKLLTERWDSPIILTTMVQFLNTLFSGEKSSTRRFRSLMNSVIIIDEIQSIPARCVHLINSALNFLAYTGHSNIILCSATQPELHQVPIPIRLSQPGDIIQHPDSLFSHLRRVNVIDKTVDGELNTEELCQFILEQYSKKHQILVILNTKKAVLTIYSELKNQFQQKGMNSDNLVYLSTNLCSAHRLKKIAHLSQTLHDGNEMICVSTPLIEAGVDLSFRTVIRSLTGLSGIAQAAGRCNRNHESDIQNVYIVKYGIENLTNLSDVVQERMASQMTLEEFSRNPDVFNNDLLSPISIARYYSHYYHDQESILSYPISRKKSFLAEDTNLYSLLSVNTLAQKCWQDGTNQKPPHPLHQAYKTAGENFEVIGKNGLDVIVPFGDGKTLAEKLIREYNIGTAYHLLRRLQVYTVHIYDNELKILNEQHALQYIESIGAYLVDTDYYNDEMGLLMESSSTGATFI